MKKQRATIKHQILTLAGSGGAPLTHSKIGEIVGVSSKTVQRTLKRVQPDLEEVENKLAAYRGLLAESLPLEHRVRRLKQLVDQDIQPMVALKALERADMLDGLAKPPDPRQGDGGGPLFGLPEGSRIAIQVNVNSLGQERFNQ